MMNVVIRVCVLLLLSEQYCVNTISGGKPTHIISNDIHNHKQRERNIFLKKANQCRLNLFCGAYPFFLVAVELEYPSKSFKAQWPSTLLVSHIHIHLCFHGQVCRSLHFCTLPSLHVWRGRRLVLGKGRWCARNGFAPEKDLVSDEDGDGVGDEDDDVGGCDCAHQRVR